ncbi:hypothetical protein HK102_013023, partial [Quaeritorhiza haematococci]
MKGKRVSMPAGVNDGDVGRPEEIYASTTPNTLPTPSSSSGIRKSQSENLDLAGSAARRQPKQNRRTSYLQQQPQPQQSTPSQLSQSQSNSEELVQQPDERQDPQQTKKDLVEDSQTSTPSSPSTSPSRPTTTSLNDQQAPSPHRRKPKKKNKQK